MATTTRVLSEEQAHECAVRIDDAERHRLQIRQLSIEHPAMTIEDAYAVQGAWVSMKLARGGRLRGRKVGLTSRAMQMSSQIDEPDYGDLLEDMFFDDGCTIPAGRSDPRVASSRNRRSPRLPRRSCVPTRPTRILSHPTRCWTRSSTAWSRTNAASPKSWVAATTATP